MGGIIFLIGAALAVIFLAGIRIVRPTRRGLIEVLGKNVGFAQPEFNWVMPVISRM